MPHKAKITLTMAEFKYRRGFSSGYAPGNSASPKRKICWPIHFSRERSCRPPAGYPVNIEVSGEDYDELIQVAENLKQFLNKESIPGVEQIKVDVNKSKPGLELNIDRRKSGGLGIAAGQIGQQLRRALFGEKAGFTKRGRGL